MFYHRTVILYHVDTCIFDSLGCIIVDELKLRPVSFDITAGDNSISDGIEGCGFSENHYHVYGYIYLCKTSITLLHILKNVDVFETVCEDEIAAAILFLLEKQKVLAEAAMYDQFPHTPHVESGVFLRKK